ncbi:MAG: hypothetical protein ACHP9W_06925 [Steroidobacterales bacterium]
MRYIPALLLALSIGAAASLYTPAAQAAGFYVGVGLPSPAFAAPLAAGVAIAPRHVVLPAYAVAPPWFGYFGPRYWGYGHGFYAYRHGGWGYRRR